MALPKILLRGLIVSIAVLPLSACKTLQENPALTSLAAAGLGYGACKAAKGKDKTCAAVGLAAGALTYGYLYTQMQEINNIQNVDAKPCASTNSQRQAYCVVMNGSAVRFQSGSSQVSPQSMGTLNQVAEVLKKSSDTLVYIEGHTDSVGDERHNQRLSEQRALSVQHVFSQKGISRDRMQALGYGESRLIGNDVANPSMQTQNRRVEIRVEGGQS